jgi:hypothetical protein
MGNLQNVSTRSIAGGAAGALTCTGIKKGDRLIAVVDTEAPSANLASEFVVTDDTITNTGGTNTTGKDLLIVWERYAGGKWGQRLTTGRSEY